MRLNRFKGVEIYGYLNFDIGFHRELTFLTGINGGGKTTVVNGVIALISPNLRVLAELDYRSIRVEFENDGVKGHIEGRREGEVISLSVSSTGEPFRFSPFVTDDP